MLHVRLANTQPIDNRAQLDFGTPSIKINHQNRACTFWTLISNITEVHLALLKNYHANNFSMSKTKFDRIFRPKSQYLNVMWKIRTYFHDTLCFF